MSLTPSALGAALAAHRRAEVPAFRGRTNHIDAAVLVPIVWAPEPLCVLTERSRDLRLHAGEICFPGGRRDETDADLQATALREAREELGIEGARVLGRLSSFPLYTSDHRLFPWVAELADGPLAPDPREVARVVRVPIRELMAAGWTHAIRFSVEGEEEMTSPLFECDGGLVYGGTAHVLLELLGVCASLLGCPPLELRTGRYDWSDVIRR